MSEQKVNLNTATVEELTQLPGIGPAVAERIITYRDTVHPFEEPVEITTVPGVSEKMYHAIADQLTVGESGESREIEEIEKVEGVDVTSPESAPTEQALAQPEPVEPEPKRDRTAQPGAFSCKLSAFFQGERPRNITATRSY